MDPPDYTGARTEPRSLETPSCKSPRLSHQTIDYKPWSDSPGLVRIPDLTVTVGGVRSHFTSIGAM
jgi:hypothetical protein